MSDPVHPNRHPRSDSGRSLGMRLVALLLLLGSWAHAGDAVRTFQFGGSVRIPTISNPPGLEAGTATSALTVGGIGGEVTKVTVAIYIRHTWVDDLDVTLVAPDGTQVELFSDVGGNNRGGGAIGGGGARPPGSGSIAPLSGVGTSSRAVPNGLVVLDDEAPAGPPEFPANVIGQPHTVNHTFVDNTPPTPDQYTPVPGAEYILSGVYRPEAPLTAFRGLVGNEVNGVWRLNIVDDAGIDAGSLEFWSLTIHHSQDHIWSGAGGDDQWSTAANWEQNYPPTNREQNAVIVFPPGTPRLTPTFNGGLDGPGTLGIRFVQVAAGYTLNGSSALNFSNNSGLQVLPASPATLVTINQEVRVGSVTTLDVREGIQLTITGDISDTFADPDGAITKTGAGTARFTGATNDYTGVTTVGQGILQVTNANGLGANTGVAASGTVINLGATLVLDGNIAIGNEALALSGSGTAGQGALLAAGNGASSWAGPITLATQLNGGSGFGVPSGTLTLSSFAAVTGFPTLNALGAGTVQLTGALPTASNIIGVNGGSLVTTVAQANIHTMNLNGGSIVPTGAITLLDTIAVSGTASGSTIGAGTVNISGGRRLTVAAGSVAPIPDLTVNAALLGGSLAIRGGGTVNWQSASTTSLTLQAGSLVGAGSSANLAVSAGRLAFTGGHTTGNLSLGENSWFVLNGAGSIVAATGSATISGGVLQPASAGTVLTTGTGNTGAFRFFPRTGSNVDYATGTGANDVVYNNAGPGAGQTAAFTVFSYAGKEGQGPVTLSITASGAMTVAVTVGGGGLHPRGDITELNPVTLPGTGSFDLTINDDFVEEGTESGSLILVPLAGGLVNAATGSATLTITDNDGDDQRTCGFGTGLTVFLLLGFALAVRARLRRP